MKKLVSQIWLAIICIILGFMITIQFRATNSSQIKNSSRQFQDMVKTLESLQKQKEELNKTLDSYISKVNEYEKSAANESVVVKRLMEEIENLKNISGLEDENGPGIVITISRPADMAKDGLYPISSYYILLLVNELNSSGVAEAISINEERFTSRTQIREVGNVIKINDTKIDPLGEIIVKVIGNPDKLAGVLNMPGNILDEIRENGFDAKPEKVDNVKILKYNMNLEFKYINN